MEEEEQKSNRRNNKRKKKKTGCEMKLPAIADGQGNSFSSYLCSVFKVDMVPLCDQLAVTCSGLFVLFVLYNVQCTNVFSAVKKKKKKKKNWILDGRTL